MANVAARRERDYSIHVARAFPPAWKIKAEHSTSAGRVDFLATTDRGHRIAIELKVKGSPEKAFRQLGRYLEQPDYDEGILVTARAYNINLEEWELEDGTRKPVSVIETWASSLP